MNPLQSLFILVPSFSPAGPIKGAIALGNALAPDHEVTLVAIKSGPGADAPIDPRVRTLVLADQAGSRLRQFFAYRQVLKQAEPGTVGAISFCLSADVFNALCGDLATTLSSVRGNLPMNYRLDYGPLGTALGYAHLFGLRRMNAVVAMNEPMAGQICRMTGRAAPIVGNFLDESPLEAFRQSFDTKVVPSIAFLGSLSVRKQPLELIRALATAQVPGDCSLQILGDGPMRPHCEAEVARLGLGGRVIFHGAVANPFKILAGTDCLVMPSLSEGTARAALEALYLGVPVVARDADGNRELVTPGVNGVLFGDNAGLPGAIAAGIALSRKLGASDKQRPNLLPEHNRQHPNAAAFVRILRQTAERLGQFMP